MSREAAAIPGPGSGVAARSAVPAATPAREERWLRAGVVALCLGAVLTAALLRPVAAGSGGRLSVAGVALPGVCAFREATGIPCPGCGLTRSWVAALHGDLAGSLRFHPLGWLVLLYALAQAARHGAWLGLARFRRGIERIGWFLDRGVVALGALLLVAWVPTLVKGLERLWG